MSWRYGPYGTWKSGWHDGWQDHWQARSQDETHGEWQGRAQRTEGTQGTGDLNGYGGDNWMSRAQYTNYSNHGSRSMTEKGEFDLARSAVLLADPEVFSRATYSYAAKTSSAIDVVSPAWTVRKLLPLSDPVVIDLSLERSLAALQMPDGGFPITAQLVAALGLADPSGALALAEDGDTAIFGSILVMKAVAIYKGPNASVLLRTICESASRLVCQRFGLTSSALLGAISLVEDTPASSEPLPADMVEVLRSNFASPGRWSFFELWARLLPTSTLQALQKEGGFLCPRFFLVDMASAAQSPYEIDKAYPIFRHGASVFVGQPAMDDGGGRDAMRQGYQLEAAVLSFGWLEEDHVLTEVQFPGVCAIFSAAPDAVVDEGAGETRPLVNGDVADYEAAGYALTEDFSTLSDKHKRCRLWSSKRSPVPPESYAEVKKTTHLNGRPGQFKMLKFWLQAALMRCGSVLVATTEGSADGETVLQIQTFPLAALERRVEARRIWGNLTAMLHYVLAETSAADGPWTLRMQKTRGLHATVRLRLTQGWDASCGGEDPARIAARVDDFFAACNKDGVEEGEADH